MIETDELPEPLGRLAITLGKSGFILRGGFHPGKGDDGVSDGGTVVLVGNAGADLWRVFSEDIPAGDNPMNRWTRATIDPIAEAHRCRAVYPFDGPPYFPFQAWAKRCDAVHSSPVGILIHSRYGLWHAYRAALVFEARLELPDMAAAASPCESCLDKPCLSACPVGAFTEDGYDVPACAEHIRSPEGSPCMTGGCLARRACPVGTDHAYLPEQNRFHMTAFERARRA